MRERLGRRAKQLTLKRTSFIRFYLLGTKINQGCTVRRHPTRLRLNCTVESPMAEELIVKSDKFMELLWGIQSWRRPH